MLWTEQNHPDMLPTDEWWVITFLVSPAIDLINVTFIVLQSRSLLITQQEELINVLIGSLVAMFNIEIVEPNMDDDTAGDVEYVLIEFMRV